MRPQLMSDITGGNLLDYTELPLELQYHLQQTLQQTPELLELLLIIHSLASILSTVSFCE